ncbi:MAG: DUF2203 domain-containing protein [Candidatus Kapaibacterium sp.]
MKLFTPKEANNTLPLVKRIISDILKVGTELREAAMASPDYEAEVEKLKKILFEYTSELEELGCLYKDWNFETGLVDFPAMIGGEHVYLCWRGDEEQVIYYHGISEGYTGRKIIPEEYL